MNREIEAYRIGLEDEAIYCYPSLLWITPEEHQRLAGSVDVAGSLRKGFA